MFNLKYADEAIAQLNEMKKKGLKEKLNKIRKTLKKLIENPRYPGLHTHKNETFATLYNEEVFQSYAENKTAAAYRIFGHYGPDKNDITILTIVNHP